MNIRGRVYFDDVMQSRGDIEVAAFVNGELRGSKLLVEPYPSSTLGYFIWTACYFNDPGETFTFKAYDHTARIEYDICPTEVIGQDGTVGTVDTPIEMHFTRTVEPTYGPEYPWVPSTDYDGEGMLVVAQIQINGELVDRASYEVGAFCGDECRGTSGTDGLDDWTDEDLGYFAFMNIEGNDDDIINFYLYDIENSKTLAAVCATTVTLQNAGELGIDIFEGDIFVLNFVTEQTFELPIEAYTTKGGYYLIASPIGDVNPENVTHMLDNTYDLYRFNQSVDLQWENYKDTEYGHNHFGLEAGRGYLYANSEDVTLIFKGFPYQGATEVELVYDGNAKLKGYNLVGNPFTEAMYINKSFYVMNPEGREELIAGTGTVGAKEGFFVIAESEGESVIFSAEAPSKANEQLVVSLNSNRGGAIDRAIVRFDNGDMLPKFQLFEDNTKLYIPQDGQDYAIVNAEDHGELPVNFKAAKNGSYTISFNTEGVTMGYLHLIDNLTGNDVDLLATNSYTFNAQSDDYASRFKLVFATGNADDNFAFFSDGNLIINNEGAATLQVVDVTGRILSSENINGCRSKTVNAAAGVYMIRLINGNNTKTQKIVVK